MPEHKWSIGADGGYADFTLSDNAINYFAYEGNSFQYANVQLNYFSGSDLFLGNIFYGQSRLQPDINLNSYHYIYNYLDFIDASLSLEYFHKVFKIANRINFFLGVSYNAQLTNKTENYSSALWVYAQGYKECGEITYANFSINALLSYQLKNYFVLCKSGFSFLDFTGRADDSFTNLYNKFYSINNYINYKFSLLCYRRITDCLDLKIECLAQYEDYKYSMDSRTLKKIASLGVSYKF
jgi:hypothetical protein